MCYGLQNLTSVEICHYNGKLSCSEEGSVLGCDAALFVE
jgi:hypothetical protein